MDLWAQPGRLHGFGLRTVLLCPQDPLLAERFGREARQELKLELPEAEDDTNKN